MTMSGPPLRRPLVARKVDFVAAAMAASDARPTIWPDTPRPPLIVGDGVSRLVPHMGRRPEQ
jgi:hypothetical protein